MSLAGSVATALSHAFAYDRHPSDNDSHSEEQAREMGLSADTMDIARALVTRIRLAEHHRKFLAKLPVSGNNDQHAFRRS